MDDTLVTRDASIQPEAERRFYTGIAVIMLVTVAVGFSRSFFLRAFFPEWPAPPEKIFLAHGAVSSAWIILFLLQASLIAGGHTRLHRRIGPFAVVLAIAVVVLGIHGSLIAAGRPGGFITVPVPPLQFLAVPLFDISLFGAFVWLAIAQRNQAQKHKRWMLLATLSMLPAAIARWPGLNALGPVAFFGITDLFIIALAVWDFRSRGRIHPVTLWGGLIVILSQPVRLLISGSDGWLAFARWATGLVS